MAAARKPAKAPSKKQNNAAPKAPSKAQSNPKPQANTVPVEDMEDDVQDDSEERAIKANMLANQAKEIRDNLVAALTEDAAEVRSGWRSYGSILREAREVLNSTKTFNKWLADNDLENFGKVETHKNERTAAMQMAALPQEVFDYVANEHPDCNKPRSFMRYYSLMEKALVEELHGLLVAGEYEAPDLKESKPKDVSKTTWASEVADRKKRANAAYRDVYSLLKDEANDTDTNLVRKSAIGQHLTLMDNITPEDLAIKVGAYSPPKGSTNFGDLTVDEAVQKILEKIKTHDSAAEIGAALVKAINETDPFAPPAEEEGEETPEEDITGDEDETEDAASEDDEDATSEDFDDDGEDYFEDDEESDEE